MEDDSKNLKVHQKIKMGFPFLEGVENLAPICGMWVPRILPT